MPGAVILECTCQVSDTLIAEMLIAYAVVAAATKLQKKLRISQEIEYIQDDRFIPWYKYVTICPWVYTTLI